MAEIKVDEKIPRYQEENPYKYSKVQLAKRKKALMDMKRDYPNLPEGWLEMVYDFHANTPEEEIEQIIDQGTWEIPGKFTQN